jgi:glycosyltransferase involved in cell wall biosynthesis
MKILHVIPYFSPKFGGPVTSTRMVCQKLAERGHQVAILTTDFCFDPAYIEQLKNVEVIPIPCQYNLGLFLYSPKMKTWLSQNLSKYDIVHMQDCRSYQHAIVSDYARRLKIPYVLQARGAVLPFFEKQLLKRCFDIVWGAKVLDNAEKVIAITEDEVAQYSLMGIPGDKIVVIPNGIDLVQYQYLPSKGLFKSKYGIPQEEKIVLFLGRIHRIKGIDLLIEAFSALCEELSNVKLVIVGPDDGFLEDLQKQITQLGIAEKIIFTGPIYGEEKLSAYVDADVYVLPSLYEAFPNTVLEAWTCGTPVIVTETCGISKIVQEAGIVIKRDSDELARGIKRLLLDGAFSRECCKKGETLIKNEFNSESVIAKIEDCYRRVIRHGMMN